MSLFLYDRTGLAIAYSDDNVNIFLFNGDAVAYFDTDLVYSYRGELLGWFEQGWLRDRDGRCIAFSDHPMGGPLPPDMKPMPVQAAKQIVPFKEPKDPKALRPIHSNAWSAQTTSDFFSRQPRRWPGSLGPTKSPE